MSKFVFWLKTQWLRVRIWYRWPIAPWRLRMVITVNSFPALKGEDFS
jgi:hypothetical protein